MIPAESAPLDYTTVEAARIPWRQVAAAITDMLAVVDAAGHTVFFNAPLERALARPLRPDLGLEDHPAAYGLYRLDGSLYPAEQLPLALALRQGTALFDVEVVLRKPDGAQLITRWNVAPLRDDTGAIVGAIGTGRDVTEQTRARQWLQASERRALLLAELGRHFTASLDLHEVLRRVAQSTAESLGDWCTIDLLDESDESRLRTVAIYNRDAVQIRRLRQGRRRQPLSSQAGLTGQVLASGEPLWIHQVTGDMLEVLGNPAEAATGRLIQPTALMILPLRGRQRVLGTLTVALANPVRWPEFDEDEYGLAQEVAGQAALAIENAQLYDRTRRQVARLTALSQVALALSRSLVLAESGPPALAALVTASRTDMAALYVGDATQEGLACVAAVGFGDGAPPPELSRDDDSPARRAIRLGTLFYSTEEAVYIAAASRAGLAALGVRCAVGLPIISQDHVIGSLVLLGRRRRRFNHADFVFLESAANQIALSIENARLYQHTRELLAAVEQSNQLKDEFISIASHELRTPLTAARGYADMLHRRLRTQPDRAADIQPLESITTQIDRMNRLISDLLDVSRMTSGHLDLRPQRLDLVALVRHVVEQQEPLAPQHPFMISAEPPSIVGTWDGARLEQVLLNLVGNAVKYSPKGGTVEVVVTGEPDQEQVTVQVRDQGIGVPPESLPLLFTRFYRAPNATQGRGGGLGIGLYVSHQIVKAHGGDISVESRPGAGATFTMHLPWHGASRALAPAPDEN